MGDAAGRKMIPLLKHIRRSKERKTKNQIVTIPNVRAYINIINKKLATGRFHTE